jgi:GT2 family glycosyltransferase
MTTHPKEPTHAETTTALPPSSLIICSRDRPRLLVELVESILEGDQIPSEMIVVDDSETANEALARMTVHRGCDIQYRWTHSRGLSRANNVGIALARYQVLVFTQDDSLVTRTWFGSLVRALVSAGSRTVVTGRVLPMEAEVANGFAPSTVSDDAHAVYEGRPKQDVLFMQNAALYRSAVDEVGPFDERLGPGTPFPAAEDNDYGLRLLNLGYRIAYVPDAVVYHRAWRGQQDYVPLRWNYGLARGGYYAKYLSLRDRYMLRRMLSDIVGHLMHGIRRLVREPRLGYGDLVLAFGIIVGAVRWGLARSRNAT